MTNEKPEENKTNLTMLSVGVLVVFLLIVGALYWFVGKKGKGNVVFPAGLNYTGNEETPAPQQPPTRPTYDYAKLAASSDWADFTSPKGQYTFKHPSAMQPLIFPGDPNDTMTFDVGDVPAQYNLMVLVETISNYDAKLKSSPKSFVQNYFKFFGGLKSMKDIEDYTTDKGLKGWKVRYVNADNIVGTDNYFFPIPGQVDKIIHVNNVFPTDGQSVFTRILNSLDYKK